MNPEELGDFQREELDRALQGKATNNKNEFLQGILAVIDGWDGALEPEELRDAAVSLTGSCPYSIEELEQWLNEEG